MPKKNISRVRKIKGTPVKISLGLKKELEKIINEYNNIGVLLTFAQASEIYRLGGIKK